MIEPNENAIRDTILGKLVQEARETSMVHPSAKELEKDKRISQLEEENAGLKEDLQEAQDRLGHLEPVFALARELAYHQNPYLQGEKQAQIAEWFRRNGYQNYFEEKGL